MKVNAVSETIPTSLKFVKTQVSEPTENDVLFGLNSSKVASQQSGNLILRELIEDSLDKYENARTKQQKMRINRHIISTMKNKHGARFLSKRSNTWVLVDDQTTRDTISRNLRVGAQKKQQRQRGIQRAHEKLAASTTTTPSDERNSDDFELDSAFQSQVEVVHRIQQQILKRLMAEDIGGTLAVHPDDENSVSSLCAFAEYL